MKEWLKGGAAAIAVLVVYPSNQDLAVLWQSPGVARSAEAESSLKGALDSLRVLWAPARNQDDRDSEVSVSDPFGLPAAVAVVANPHQGLEVLADPPARPWKATGRVGERAAVLTNPDGRVQVVSIGQNLDSAKVVGIGSSGVELEDRGGRFILRLP